MPEAVSTEKGELTPSRGGRGLGSRIDRDGTLTHYIQTICSSRSYLHSIVSAPVSVQHHIMQEHDIFTKLFLYLLKTTSSGNSEGDCGNGGKCRPMGWGLFGNSNAFANLLLARPWPLVEIVLSLL